MSKPRFPLRLVRDDPESLAKAVLDGNAGPEALVDDDVFKAAMDMALGKTRQQAAAQVAGLDDYYARAAAARFGKGSDDMSVFGVDLESVNQMTEAALVMYAARVEQGVAATNSPIEKQQYLAFGAEVQKALMSVAASKAQMAKAILTKEPDDTVSQAAPPAKNKGKGVSKDGKAAYKYDKPHGGKGPGKQPKSKKGVDTAPADAPEAAGDQDPAVSPPPPIDPAALATKLGVKVENLKTLAAARTRDKFIAYFAAFPAAVKQCNLTAQYLSALYDALTAPPAPPPAKVPPGAPSPKSAAAPGTGGPPASAPAMGKAVLHFVGASRDKSTQKLLKALKTQGVQNAFQMQAVLKAHFALDDVKAVHLTRTLLRQWEADAVVNLTSA